MSFNLQATSFKLRSSSYELQVTSYETQDASYKQRDTRYKIVTAPADDSTVQPCILVRMYGADLHRTLIELS
jgi:hypothetical protein